MTTCGPRVMWTANRMINTTVAINSMKTPAVLIVAINLTPNALTRVVNRISTAARTTALVATSYLPVPSPTNWKKDGTCGSVNREASATGEMHTMEAMNIIQPASQPRCGLPTLLDQL